MVSSWTQKWGSHGGCGRFHDRYADFGIAGLILGQEFSQDFANGLRSQTIFPFPALVLQRADAVLHGFRSWKRPYSSERLYVCECLLVHKNLGKMGKVTQGAALGANSGLVGGRCYQSRGGNMAIHDTAATTLTEMGLCKAPAAFVRTVLTWDGYFVGEKYRFDGGYAAWIAATNVIEVYDDAGKLLKTVAIGTAEKGSAA
jgi:hypothetical protein